NLELGITKTIQVKSNDEGEIVLTATLLSNIINKMPDGNISFETDEKLLTLIKCDDIEFTILGLNSEEFPEMPTISDSKEFCLNQVLLKNMISQTIFCISQNDQNPVHTGSLFDLSNGQLTIVSVDGYRLALRKADVTASDDFKFIIPGKTLSEIVKLLSRFSDDKEDISISVSNKHISFSISGYVIISRLIEGNFLDYKNTIPKECKTTVELLTKEFLETINRTSIIINERAKSPVKCHFENNSIKVFCETALGKVNDSVDCKITGEDVKIGFNNKYMADALKSAECDKIKIELNGPISPMKISPIDDDRFLFLVLPVRLN
ncbi:MAG: DNA polymerase III subunit beta, partial [Oscillospiraceae bacterium]